MKYHQYYMVFVYNDNGTTGNMTAYFSYDTKGLNAARIKNAQKEVCPDINCVMLNAIYLGYMTDDELHGVENGE